MSEIKARKYKNKFNFDIDIPAQIIIEEGGSSAPAHTDADNIIENLTYVNVDRSNTLDIYIQEKCKSLLRRISAHPNRYRLYIQIRPESRDDQSKLESYGVTGTLYVKGRKDFKVKCNGRDIRFAIDQVVFKLEKKLRRESQKRLSRRRKIGRSLQPISDYFWDMTMAKAKLAEE